MQAWADAPAHTAEGSSSVNVQGQPVPVRGAAESLCAGLSLSSLWEWSSYPDLLSLRSEHEDPVREAARVSFQMRSFHRSRVSEPLCRTGIPEVHISSVVDWGPPQRSWSAVEDAEWLSFPTTYLLHVSRSDPAGCSVPQGCRDETRTQSRTRRGAGGGSWPRPARLCLPSQRPRPWHCRARTCVRMGGRGQMPPEPEPERGPRARAKAGEAASPRTGQPPLRTGRALCAPGRATCAGDASGHPGPETGQAAGPSVGSALGHPVQGGAGHARGAGRGPRLGRVRVVFPETQAWPAESRGPRGSSPCLTPVRGPVSELPQSPEPPEKLLAGFLGLCCLVLMCRIGAEMVYPGECVLPTQIVLGNNSQSHAANHCGPCPEDWVSYSNNCYYFSAETKSWSESVRACESKNAQLLYVESDQELVGMSCPSLFKDDLLESLIYPQNSHERLCKPQTLLVSKNKQVSCEGYSVLWPAEATQQAAASLKAAETRPALSLGHAEALAGAPGLSPPACVCPRSALGPGTAEPGPACGWGAADGRPRSWSRSGAHGHGSGQVRLRVPSQGSPSVGWEMRTGRGPLCGVSAGHLVQGGAGHARGARRGQRPGSGQHRIPFPETQARPAGSCGPRGSSPCVTRVQRAVAELPRTCLRPQRSSWPGSWGSAAWCWCAGLEQRWFILMHCIFLTQMVLGNNSQSRSANHCGPCPEGWVSYSDNCYHFHAERKTWSESMRSCQSENSQLLYVESERELTLCRTGIPEVHISSVVDWGLPQRSWSAVEDAEWVNCPTTSNQVPPEDSPSVASRRAFPGRGWERVTTSFPRTQPTSVCSFRRPPQRPAQAAAALEAAETRTQSRTRRGAGGGSWPRPARLCLPSQRPRPWHCRARTCVRMGGRGPTPPEPAPERGPRARPGAGEAASPLTGQPPAGWRRGQAAGPSVGSALVTPAGQGVGRGLGRVSIAFHSQRHRRGLQGPSGPRGSSPCVTPDLPAPPEKLLAGFLGLCCLVLVCRIGALMAYAESSAHHCGPCPEGWVTHSNSCYYLSDEGKTWSESMMACAAKKSHLLYIRNQEEMVRMVQKLNSYFNQYYISIIHPYISTIFYIFKPFITHSSQGKNCAYFSFQNNRLSSDYCAETKKYISLLSCRLWGVSFKITRGRGRCDPGERGGRIRSRWQITASSRGASGEAPQGTAEASARRAPLSAHSDPRPLRTTQPPRGRGPDSRRGPGWSRKDPASGGLAGARPAGCGQRSPRDWPRAPGRRRRLRPDRRGAGPGEGPEPGRACPRVPGPPGAQRRCPREKLEARPMSARGDAPMRRGRDWGSRCPRGAQMALLGRPAGGENGLFQAPPEKLVAGLLGFTCLALMCGIGAVIGSSPCKVIISDDPSAARHCVHHCPEGWVTFSGSCYYVSTERRTWSESEAACAAESSSLLHADNQAEMDFRRDARAAHLHRVSLSSLRPAAVLSSVCYLPSSSDHRAAPGAQAAEMSDQRVTYSELHLAKGADRQQVRPKGGKSSSLETPQGVTYAELHLAKGADRQQVRPKGGKTSSPETTQGVTYAELTLHGASRAPQDNRKSRHCTGETGVDTVRGHAWAGAPPEKLVAGLLGLACLVLMCGVIGAVMMHCIFLTQMVLGNNSQSRSANHCGPCPEGWVSYSDNCYHFHAERKTWSESMRSCQSENSQLLYVESERELGFLKSISALSWTGVYRSGPDSPAPPEKLLAGFLGLCCLVLVCRIGAVMAYAESSAHHCGPCPEGWVTYSNSCYYLSDEEKTWNESVSACAARKSHLLYIYNQGEMNYLQIFNIFPWVGVSRRTSESPWLWANGSEFTSKLFITHSSQGKNCAYFSFQNNRLSSDYCAETKKYISLLSCRLWGVSFKITRGRGRCDPGERGGRIRSRWQITASSRGASGEAPQGTAEASARRAPLSAHSDPRPLRTTQPPRGRGPDSRRGPGWSRKDPASGGLAGARPAGCGQRSPRDWPRAPGRRRRLRPDRRGAGPGEGPEPGRACPRVPGPPGAQRRCPREKLEARPMSARGDAPMRRGLDWGSRCPRGAQMALLGRPAGGENGRVRRHAQVRTSVCGDLLRSGTCAAARSVSYLNDLLTAEISATSGTSRNVLSRSVWAPITKAVTFPLTLFFLCAILEINNDYLFGIEDILRGISKFGNCKMSHQHVTYAELKLAKDSGRQHRNPRSTQRATAGTEQETAYAELQLHNASRGPQGDDKKDHCKVFHAPPEKVLAGLLGFTCLVLMCGIGAVIGSSPSPGTPKPNNSALVTMKPTARHCVHPCPEGWVTFSGSCYYISTERRNWSESEAACAAESSSLLHIDNQAEMEFLSIFEVFSWVDLARSTHDNSQLWPKGLDFSSTGTGAHRNLVTPLTIGTVRTSSSSACSETCCCLSSSGPAVRTLPPRASPTQPRDIPCVRPSRRMNHGEASRSLQLTGTEAVSSVLRTLVWVFMLLMRHRPRHTSHVFLLCSLVLFSKLNQLLIINPNVKSSTSKCPKETPCQVCRQLGRLWLRVAGAAEERPAPCTPALQLPLPAREASPGEQEGEPCPALKLAAVPTREHRNSPSSADQSRTVTTGVELRALHGAEGPVYPLYRAAEAGSGAHEERVERENLGCSSQAKCMRGRAQCVISGSPGVQSAPAQPRLVSLVGEVMRVQLWTLSLSWPCPWGRPAPAHRTLLSGDNGPAVPLQVCDTQAWADAPAHTAEGSSSVNVQGQPVPVRGAAESLCAGLSLSSLWEWSSYPDLLSLRPEHEDPVREAARVSFKMRSFHRSCVSETLCRTGIPEVHISSVVDWGPPQRSWSAVEDAEWVNCPTTLCEEAVGVRVGAWEGELLGCSEGPQCSVGQRLGKSKLLFTNPNTENKVTEKKIWELKYFIKLEMKREYKEMFYNPKIRQPSLKSNRYCVFASQSNQVPPEDSPSVASRSDPRRPQRPSRLPRRDPHSVSDTQRRWRGLLASARPPVSALAAPSALALQSPRTCVRMGGRGPTPPEPEPAPERGPRARPGAGEAASPRTGQPPAGWRRGQAAGPSKGLALVTRFREEQVTPAGLGGGCGLGRVRPAGSLGPRGSSPCVTRVQRAVSELLPVCLLDSPAPPEKLLAVFLGLYCLVLVCRIGAVIYSSPSPETPKPNNSSLISMTPKVILLKMQCACDNPSAARRCVHPCPEGWVTFSRSCYYVSSERRTWSESEAACAAESSSLLHIDNQAEMKKSFISVSIRHGGAPESGDTAHHRDSPHLQLLRVFSDLLLPVVVRTCSADTAPSRVPDTAAPGTASGQTLRPSRRMNHGEVSRTLLLTGTEALSSVLRTLASCVAAQSHRRSHRVRVTTKGRSAWLEVWGHRLGTGGLDGRDMNNEAGSFDLNSHCAPLPRDSITDSSAQIPPKDSDGISICQVNAKWSGLRHLTMSADDGHLRACIGPKGACASGRTWAETRGTNGQVQDGSAQTGMEPSETWAGLRGGRPRADGTGQHLLSQCTPPQAWPEADGSRRSWTRPSLYEIEETLGGRSAREAAGAVGGTFLTALRESRQKERPRVQQLQDEMRELRCLRILEEVQRKQPPTLEMQTPRGRTRGKPALCLRLTCFSTRSPESRAAEMSDERVTYAELNVAKGSTGHRKKPKGTKGSTSVPEKEVTYADLTLGNAPRALQGSDSSNRCKGSAAPPEKLVAGLLGLACLVLMCSIGAVMESSAHHCGPCPEGWITYSNSCYYLSDEGKTWNESMTACAARKSHLLHIDNQEEMVRTGMVQRLSSYFNQYCISIVHPYFLQYFVCLNHETAYNKFQFTIFSSQGKNCAYFSFQDNGLYSENCAETKKYICKMSHQHVTYAELKLAKDSGRQHRNPRSTQRATAGTEQETAYAELQLHNASRGPQGDDKKDHCKAPHCVCPCPEGWLTFSGSCYYISTESRTWRESEVACAAESSSLLHADHQAEMSRAAEMSDERVTYAELNVAKGSTGHRKKPKGTKGSTSVPEKEVTYADLTLGNAPRALQGSDSSNRCKGSAAPPEKLVAGLLGLACLVLMCSIGAVMESSAHHCGPCPKGWVTYSNSCYYLSDEGKTWNKSLTACAARKSHLLHIDNQEEMRARIVHILILKKTNFLLTTVQKQKNTCIQLHVLISDNPSAAHHCVHHCPEGWVTFSGSCYYVSTERRTWSESEAACAAESSSLLHVDNQAEMVRWIADSSEKDKSCPCFNLLLKRLSHESCAEKKFYICSAVPPEKLVAGLLGLLCLVLMCSIIAAVMVNPTSSAHHCGPCPEGWVTYSNSCYYLSDEGKTWNESVSACAARKSHLLYIDNQGEMNYLQIFNIFPWVGVSRRTSEASWLWANGSEFTSKLFIIHSSQGKNCAYFSFQNNRLSSDYCSETKKYMWERGRRKENLGVKANSKAGVSWAPGSPGVLSRPHCTLGLQTAQRVSAQAANTCEREVAPFPAGPPRAFCSNLPSRAPKGHVPGTGPIELAQNGAGGQPEQRATSWPPRRCASPGGCCSAEAAGICAASSEDRAGLCDQLYR
ncbi:NKG2-A/NKG2-B type II integral membrane protein [Galemys pyrenaicus]|uniref:NKG2-A/NKG2-B type II integral membrane protein n=1 Tax=Galemys pyrenaicus TaxID=202257 RepID=A0A8J5ZTC8_GALPY|nr:NKG2-A/NKG2-B type II integral membrane protein [Galemys pyrenaicus]